MTIAPSSQISSNRHLRRLAVILTNGSHAFLTGHFPAHSGFKINLLKAYDTGDEDAWKTLMQSYLTQAGGHVAQAANSEEAAELLSIMDEFIEHYGLAPIAHYFLPFM